MLSTSLSARARGSHAVPPSLHRYNRPKASGSARQPSLFCMRAAMRSIHYVPFQGVTLMVSLGSSAAATRPCHQHSGPSGDRQPTRAAAAPRTSVSHPHGGASGGWAWAARARAPRTVPDRVQFCSGGTGGSAGGPSCGTRDHSANTRHIRHTGCLSGLCAGGLCASSMSSVRRGPGEDCDDGATLGPLVSCVSGTGRQADRANRARALPQVAVERRHEVM